MQNLEQQIPSNDHEFSLLEGLFQLTVSGHTEGWEFEQINDEVYLRLQQAYTV